jgi:zinc protease
MSAAVFQQIDSLTAHGPTEDEMVKVKEQQRRSRETDLRENGFWLSQLVSADLYDYDPRIILEYDQLVEGLTAEALQEAARLYLNTDNYVQVSLIPEEKKEESN